MEIYPPAQAEMFLAAFALGLGAGVLRLVCLALRTVLGAYLPPEHMRTRYDCPLPLLHRPVGFPAHPARKTWRVAVAFFGDILFCLVCAIALLFLLYDYNEGAWRISVFLLFVLGLVLFHKGSARFFARLNDFFAVRTEQSQNTVQRRTVTACGDFGMKLHPFDTFKIIGINFAGLID